MRPVVAAGYVLVPLFGVFMCIGPLVTRSAVQFGVRVPSEYSAAPVIGRERRSYRWRSAVIAICAAAALIAWGGHTSWVPSRVILLVELTADMGCFWWAHRRIAKVKLAEGWFAGRRQTVVADTSWRTEPQPFPIGWLAPAAAVIVATVVIGVLRYPHLPAYLSRGGGHRVGTSPVSAFAVVFAQAYVTALWTGLLALVYRSRPDLDTADPAASLRSYRTALGVFGRAGLVLLACVDLSLLLHALQLWQVLHLSGDGTVLVLVPFALGLLGFFYAVIRAGAARARVAKAAATDRDDDRFWKAGIVYVNRDDPAVLVGARVAFGWTVNLGNPTAWLLIAGFVTVPAALVALGVTTGI